MVCRRGRETMRGIHTHTHTHTHTHAEREREREREREGETCFKQRYLTEDPEPLLPRLLRPAESMLSPSFSPPPPPPPRPCPLWSAQK